MTSNQRSYSESSEAKSSAGDRPRQLCTGAMTIAIEQRGHDVFGYELDPGLGIADYAVVVSATSARHARGMADKIREFAAKQGFRILSESGTAQSLWILLDYGDVIVHIFHEPVRHFYQLDELLKHAHPVELSDDLKKEAEKLRTGMVR